MRKILGEGFFERDTVSVAKDLLGKFLVRRIRRKEVALTITEVEVYDGFRDKASHAARGKTARNSIMFGPAGHWYIYFTYGMYWMLNIVTREKGYPAAVLIRGGVEADKRGLKNIRSGYARNVLNGPARQNFYKSKNLGGPAKLTKFLKIDKKLNGLPANRKSGLWIEGRGYNNNDSRIYPPKFSSRKFWRVKRGPRIGVSYAGPYWAKRKWRFWIE